MTADEVPPGVDVEKPSAARVYDWYLGGSQNWAVDREFGRRAERVWPLIRPISRQNRAFMNRVVRAALEAGIRQFVDLGSGVPTAGNVHEIVRDRWTAPDRRPAVVYVDYEAVAAAHSTLILEREGATDWAGLVRRDIREPEAVFADETTRRLIDWSQPVCLLMITVLHFIGPADEPDALMAAYREKLAPGSWLAVTHGTCTEDAPPERAAGVRRFVDAYRDTSNPAYLRSAEEIRPWFGGWPLLEPGMTALPDWRPSSPVSPLEAETRPFAWCAVARRP
ncbi:SAM-dependent methyltransferase [Amycolatopsis sp. PS_44_ISF1]|uniref:SAM-dependent methyltransferase n=1 Tax=Amycolatopsis sp. PS_44_ISF1 TaxID=2974917 RepID=UPI0028DE83F0|nr:SAM-dependent methyltransferase [Amycolatopsis sp. PS_44_ISF1]MDT8909820.1 SAM-dependent methyltransferase [Amycolatopsis sp. PS_44_ISF1]